MQSNPDLCQYHEELCEFYDNSECKCRELGDVHEFCGYYKCADIVTCVYKELQQAKQALTFYAQGKHYKLELNAGSGQGSWVIIDHGQVAQEVLKKI